MYILNIFIYLFIVYNDVYFILNILFYIGKITAIAEGPIYLKINI